MLYFKSAGLSKIHTTWQQMLQFQFTPLIVLYIITISLTVTMMFVSSGEEPKRQPFVSVRFPGSAGLRGALSTPVLVDAHDSHSAKRLRTAGSSAGKSTAAAAAHHSYRTGQQPGGRRRLHRSPQHAHSDGHRHVGHWWWNRLPRADGHHDHAGQCRTRSRSSAASQGSNWLVDKMVRIYRHRHVLKFKEFVHRCL